MTDEMEGQMSFADLGLWFGKTCPEPCPQTTEKTSAQSSKKSSVLPNRMPMCLDLRNRGLMQVASWDMDGLLLGEYTMHSFGECPKDVVESHLSQILQVGVPRRYCLSATACKGILRRALERGKELPELLRKVLEKQSHSKTDADVRGGARECLCNETERVPSQPSIINTSSHKTDVYNLAVTGDVAASITACGMTNANGSGPRVIEKSEKLKPYPCSVYGEKVAPTLVRGISKQCGNTQDGCAIIDDVRCFSETQFGGYSEGSSSLKASGGSQGGGQRNLNPDIIGSLCARDTKGVGNQYVDEGKVIVDIRTVKS